MAPRCRSSGVATVFDITSGLAPAMLALTTMVGRSMFGTGMGSELRHPLGISIVGGLLVSQMLTLFTTPVIYIYFDRWGQELREWRARRRGGESAPAPARI